jgi:small subunit ribosomal protein S16
LTKCLFDFKILFQVISGGFNLAVHIRLMRFGKKKQPSYRVVVVDSRAPRNGAYIESLGYYSPLAKESQFKIDLERYEDWVRKGAQPTLIVKKLVGKVSKKSGNIS